MNVGVNKPFKGYVQEVCNNFLIKIPEDTKVRKEGFVQWVHTEWEEVKVKTITTTWKTIGINVQDIALV